jgi:hypothetical protein
MCFWVEQNGSKKFVTNVHVDIILIKERKTLFLADEVWYDEYH